MSEPPKDDDKKPKRPKEFSASGSRGDDFITRNLKKAFEEVAAEPLPDDLMQLLNQLDAPPEGKRDE